MPLESGGQRIGNSHELESIVQHCDASNSEHVPPSVEPSWRQLLGRILGLGWPTCLNLFLNQVPGIVLLAFLGGDSDEMAAAGVGYMFSNITGMCLIAGSAGGAQPLISQAFGARSYPRCGDLLQQQLAIHGMLGIAIAIIWWNTESILLFFGQPARVASLAGVFIRCRLLGLPSMFLRQDMIYFCIAQRVMVVPMFLSVSANMLNVLLFPLLIPVLGFAGAPLAMTLAQTVHALSLFVVAPWALPHQEAWPRWSWRIAFDTAGWRQLLDLSLPSAVLMLSEWWGWEVNLFFAGLLCKSGAGACVELDVFPVASHTMVILFFSHYGCSLAASTLVGNALGEGDVATAKRVAKVILCLAITLGGCLASILVALRRRWGDFFTEDEQVVQMLSGVLPYVAAYVFLDAVGPGALTSLLRGMGVVRVPALIAFVSFYIVGLPCGVHWAFAGSASTGIVGLWWGLVVAMGAMCSSLLIYLLVFADWQEAAQQAQHKALSKAASPPIQECSDGAELST